MSVFWNYLQFNNEVHCRALPGVQSTVCGFLFQPFSFTSSHNPFLTGDKLCKLSSKGRKEDLSCFREEVTFMDYKDLRNEVLLTHEVGASDVSKTGDYRGSLGVL